MSGKRVAGGWKAAGTCHHRNGVNRVKTVYTAASDYVGVSLSEAAILVPIVICQQNRQRNLCMLCRFCVW